MTDQFRHPTKIAGLISYYYYNLNAFLSASVHSECIANLIYLLLIVHYMYLSYITSL